MLPTGQTLPECLEDRGVSRRAFLNFCGVMAATLALPATLSDADRRGARCRWSVRC